MGGSLDVESSPGTGSTFTLRLPLRETEAPFESSTLIMPASRRLAGLRVLVAEDNPINQMVITDLLQGEGAETELADNGRQVLEAVINTTRPYDAVLMDVQMPVLDGLEATKLLKQTYPALPVIGQTAHALQEEHDKCLAAGMDVTIHKPINLEVLVSTLLQWTQARDQASPTTPAVTTTPTPAAVVAVDWSALDQRYSNRQPFVDRLVKLTLEEHGADGVQLRNLASSGDMKAIAQLAHNLKGTAGNLYAPEVQQLAIQVLSSARAREADTLQQTQQLADAVDRMIEAFRQGRPSQP